MSNYDDLIELIRTRHSGSEYAEYVIKEHEIKKLIEAGRWAPSSYGAEPWRYIICVKGNAMWDRVLLTLVEKNRVWVKNASLVMVCVGASKNHDGTSNDWQGYDCGAASYGIALGAHAMGLMAHQMGGFDRQAMRALFGIPDDFSPWTVIAIGKEKIGAQPRVRVRSDISTKFFTEKWASN